MKTLFLIPARGGSKGFPGKNTALLAGVPLVGWAARSACQAALVHTGSRVVCSTDDSGIAGAAALWGAEVPFTRPAALAIDESDSLSVVVHALDMLGDSFEAVALLQPTSPLTALDDLLGALELFADTGGPVVSVFKEQHPREWSYQMYEDGRLQSISAAAVTRRQLAEATYQPNGAIYIASPAQIRSEGFFGPRMRGYQMPPGRSVDVDSPLDLAVADALLADRPVPAIAIGERTIGPGHPCFVIAEAGVNHNGSLDLALRLVDAAAEAGADAVKFQTFTAEKVVSPAAPKAAYQEVNTGKSGSQLEMVRELELDTTQHHQIQAHCREKGIMFLSSPFDSGSVDLLVKMGVHALKIGSGELTNHEFLAYLARRKLPLLLSTGMSAMHEVENALAVFRRNGAPPVALLHCVSNYPAAPCDCNLAAMDSMRKAFCLPIGWSDHTLGLQVSLAAVARGAAIIERHLTLDKSLPGPDHAASLEPEELRALVKGVRDIEVSKGTGVKQQCPSEQNTAAVARRSIHAATTLTAGHQITSEDIVMLRPGTGIPADQVDGVLGRTVSRTIPAGHILSYEDLG